MSGEVLLRSYRHSAKIFELCRLRCRKKKKKKIKIHLNVHLERVYKCLKQIDWINNSKSVGVYLTKFLNKFGCFAIV